MSGEVQSSPSLVQSRPDRVHHLIGTGEDVVVPETEEAEILAAKIRVSGNITGGLDVLGAVGFDDQAGVEADKVDDEGRNWELATKFVECKSAVAQQKPESLFSVGGPVAHGLRPGQLQPRYFPVLGGRIPLIRPAGTFSRRGRRQAGVCGLLGGINRRRTPLSPCGRGWMRSRRVRGFFGCRRRHLFTSHFVARCPCSSL